MNGIHPPSEEESVQPSSVLIGELHRRLFDPGVASAFEQEHRRGVEDHDHLIDRVVRPRWVLLPAFAAAADGGSEGSIVVEATTVHDNVVKQHHEDANTMALTRRYQSNNNTDDEELYELEIINPRYSTNDTKKSGDEQYNNGIPTRNYIDLRMEQNRIFADDQSRKCHDILSTIKLLFEQHASGTERSSSSTNDNNNDELLLEKHAKSLHSLLHEGLCACPNHVGLLQVQTNYAEWLQQGRNVEMSDDTYTKSTLISHNDTQYNSSINVTRPPPRKGVEGRTHAAMHDVRTERSFLTHGGGGDDGDATMIRGYSLLPPTAIDDTIVMCDVAAVKDGRRKNSFEHNGESNGNESPPYCKERRQRRRKHDRRRRRRGKDDRSCKRRRRIEYEQSSSTLLHHRHHRHRRRSQSCESSGSNRSEVSRSSSYTHSSSSSSYSRRRKHRHRKEEKKSRRSSKSKAKKSKKSKHYHHRKSRSCDTVEEEGNNDGCGRNTGRRSVGKSEEAMFC